MIAHLGPNLPHDLFDATGRNAGALRWNVDRAMPAADRWLESKFAPWTRSVVQDWADGALDHLEAVVFSRADDSAQRLYYYMCELRRTGAVRGPEPLMLDIAKIPRASSVARTEAALRALGARLGLLWLIEEDDTSVWHLPAMRAALEGLGLPVMVATRRDWLCRDGIDLEMGAFLAGAVA